MNDVPSLFQPNSKKNRLDDHDRRIASLEGLVAHVLSELSVNGASIGALEISIMDLQHPKDEDGTLKTEPGFDLIEMAWGLIANAYGGNWQMASKEWEGAAARWRDAYHRHLKIRNGPQVEMGDVPMLLNSGELPKQQARLVAMLVADGVLRYS